MPSAPVVPPSIPPLALYVHLPWCVRKCPYCDFNSHPMPGCVPETEYVAALLQDLDQEAAGLGDRPLESVFIGGGTPSLFSGPLIARLLDGIRDRLVCAPGMEITLEANPGTVEAGRFEHYRRAGVNRLSLGIQSFSTDCLKRLGRIHDPRQARDAVAMAREAGFANLNLDLMYGLPGQSLADAGEDLASAVALCPEHISYYQLTLEPNTAFARQPPELPNDDLVAEMHLRGQEILSGAGYRRYEVSAYSRDSMECRHNLNYWRFGDYLGIGAGAHGKLTDRAFGNVTRRWKKPHPQAYLASAKGGYFAGGSRQMKVADRRFEFMMNALRLDDGFTRELFERRTGSKFSELAPLVAIAIERGLLEQGVEIRATELGRRFLNDLLHLFLPDGEAENA